MDEGVVASLDIRSLCVHDNQVKDVKEIPRDFVKKLNNHLEEEERNEITTNQILEEEENKMREEILKDKELYGSLIEICPKSLANKISSKARNDKPEVYTGCSFVYGEIMFEPFGLSIKKIQRKYGGLKNPKKDIFYDLGSGAGKPVFAASLLHEWGGCYGVELVTELYDISLNMKEKWEIDIVPKLPADKVCEIEFYNQDICTFDFNKATLLFANSTCFDRALMLKIAENIKTVPIGTFLITFTKQLPCNLWIVREFKTYNMSWGPATVFIHEKISM